jgi:tripartite-type tricarboxylate transporter receptor subunit TctC
VTRHPRLPDVPTLAEEGFPDIRAIQWVGMFTTAGTPKPMLDRLNTELNRIVRLPDVIEKLKQQGVTATGSTQEEFAKLIATEIKNWTEIAHEANIKID